MVSANNITYSEQIYKPFSLRREGRQMPDAEQLLYQTEKAATGGFL